MFYRRFATWIVIAVITLVLAHSALAQSTDSGTSGCKGLTPALLEWLDSQDGQAQQNTREPSLFKPLERLIAKAAEKAYGTCKTSATSSNIDALSQLGRQWTQLFQKGDEATGTAAVGWLKEATKRLTDLIRDADGSSSLESLLNKLAVQ
jgi:hypothetical protein